MGSKRLNLSNKKDEELSSSSDEEVVASQQSDDAASQSSGEEESDEEFEIPAGFEGVKGSSAILKESILSEDKELWFFKLPKNMDASALADVSFNLSKKATAVGTAVAHVKKDNKRFALQTEDAFVTSQLVNAFPQASDRKKFVLGKPFARCFSLVEDRSEEAASPTAVEEATTSKKSKAAPASPASTKKAKKQKVKK
ncbi:TPA: hypothetical protein N0F65_001930 [Lagenidium giganteum]|uniref:Uncharacterized protein n=1 Tax=Lagenidium giganteum TaxID=4803 RepID=A0AAV2YVB4_9STRA|nr:TPA: hypothetical protein N0F65_001930 [Lagenidium giganteum]